MVVVYVRRDPSGCKTVGGRAGCFGSQTAGTDEDVHTPTGGLCGVGPSHGLLEQLVQPVFHEEEHRPVRVVDPGVEDRPGDPDLGREEQDVGETRLVDVPVSGRQIRQG